MDGGLRRHDVVGALRVKLLALLMQCAWLQIKQTFLCRHPGIAGTHGKPRAHCLPWMAAFAAMTWLGH
jgi:hypothetical protein